MVCYKTKLVGVLFECRTPSDHMSHHILSSDVVLYLPCNGVSAQQVSAVIAGGAGRKTADRQATQC